MSKNIYIKSVLFKSAICKTPAVILKIWDHVRFGEMFLVRAMEKSGCFLLLLLFLKQRFKILQTESCRQHSGHHANDVDEEFLGRGCLKTPHTKRSNWLATSFSKGPSSHHSQSAFPAPNFSAIPALLTS